MDSGQRERLIEEISKQKLNFKLQFCNKEGLVLFSGDVCPFPPLEDEKEINRLIKGRSKGRYRVRDLDGLG